MLASVACICSRKLPNVCGIFQGVALVVTGRGLVPGKSPSVDPVGLGSVGTEVESCLERRSGLDLEGTGDLSVA